MNGRLLFTVALYASLMPLGPAYAHAMLERASPSAGTAASGSPGAVRMWFTEKLESKFSGATITGPSGQKVGGRASVSGSQMTVGLPRLGAGLYRVNWHAVSVDTHRTEGSFTFEVK